MVEKIEQCKHTNIYYLRMYIILSYRINIVSLSHSLFQYYRLVVLVELYVVFFLIHVYNCFIQ